MRKNILILQLIKSIHNTSQTLPSFNGKTIKVRFFFYQDICQEVEEVKKYLKEFTTKKKFDFKAFKKFIQEKKKSKIKLYPQKNHKGGCLSNSSR